MGATRVAKTFDRLRAGELPSPAGLTKFVSHGLGTTCTGCGEVVGRSEHCYYIRVAGGVSLLAFHVVCHETWVRFKRNGSSPSPAPEPQASPQAD